MEHLIDKVFKPLQLDKKYLSALLDRAHDLYTQAFTTAALDPVNNYEFFELLGDASANKFLPWYFFRRFPQLHCTKGVKVLARLKINYAAKRSFAGIAEKLGFWPHIRIPDHQAKFIDKMSLLEDVFEAFIGVTEYILDSKYIIGVGNAVVYQLLQHIFDQMDISLKYEDLYDAKTRLKELFDAHALQLGSLVYEETGTSSKLYRKPVAGGGERILLAEGYGGKQADRHQMAAKQALIVLQNQGYAQKHEYELICE